MVISRLKNAKCALLASLAIAPGLATQAYAQDASAAALGVAGGPNPEFGIPVEGWMLYPSLLVGTVFNDNIYSTATNRKSGFGLRLRPSIEANRDAGIHLTTVYANADAQVYPGRGASYTLYPTYSVLATPTHVTGRAGFSHVYKPLPDLTFTLVGDYTRNNGLFGSSFGAGAPQTPVASAASVTANGTVSNQFTGSLSVEKKLTERAFVRAATGVQYVSYDSAPTNLWLSTLTRANLGNNTQPNGLSYTGSLRGGYWITPQVYAFVEPGVDLRRYQNSWNDTNGYKIIGGLGSDMISLFRGEIYGGYQSQSSANGRFASASSPTFGGRLYYYPTRFVTFTATVDQTFTAPLAQTATYFGMPVGNVASSASRTLQARLQADYAFSPYWTAFARAGYGETRYNASWSAVSLAMFIPGGLTSYYNAARSTKVWTAGAGMSYTFWRNFALTLEYQFSKSNPTNVNAYAWWPPTGITQNLVTAGVTYRY